VVVVGVSIDDSLDGVTPPTSLVGPFATANSMNYPIVMTRPDDSSVEDDYGNIAYPSDGYLAYIPTTFIIDRHNQIVQTFVGEQTYSTFAGAIQPLLGPILPTVAALTISSSNGRVNLSWPVTQTAFVLQSATTLAGGGWSPVSAPAQSDGTTWRASLPSSTGVQYFRLRSQ
jgi:hypothetical protein